MDDKTILVRTKNVYGKELVYPVCPDAEHFASLAGTKTLSYDNLRTITQLGYKVIEATRTKEYTF